MIPRLSAAGIRFISLRTCSVPASSSFRGSSPQMRTTSYGAGPVDILRPLPYSSRRLPHLLSGSSAPNTLLRPPPRFEYRLRLSSQRVLSHVSRASLRNQRWDSQVVFFQQYCSPHPVVMRTPFSPGGRRLLHAGLSLSLSFLFSPAPYDCTVYGCDLRRAWPSATAL